MRLLLVAATAVAAQEAETKKPILTTKIIHDTAEFFLDLFDSVHSRFLKPHIDKHSETVVASVAQILPADPIEEVCGKLNCDAKQVKDYGKMSQEYAALALEIATAKYTEIHALLTQYTNFVVDAFETALPKYAGIVERTPANLFLVVLWVAAAAYGLIKLALLAFWISSTIFCCLCCCGCCCLRKKAKVDDAEPKKNGNKASKAAEKGKAATPAATSTNKSGQGKAKK